MNGYHTPGPWHPPPVDMDHRRPPLGSFDVHPSHAVGLPGPGIGPTIVQVCPDVKPRLTKDQHEILERHFAQQPKPSTSVKKGFADALGVPLDKINNWFQNRRAKVKQDAKKQLNAFNLFQATLAQHSQQYYQHPHKPLPQPGPSVMPQYFAPPPVVPSHTAAPPELPLRPSTAPHLSADPHIPGLAQPAGMPPQQFPGAGFPHHQHMSLQPPLPVLAPGLPFAPHFAQDMHSTPDLLGPGLDFGQQFSAVDFDSFMSQQPADMPPTSTGNSSWLTPSASVSPNTVPCVLKLENGNVSESPPQLSQPSGHPTPTDSTYTASSAAQGTDLLEQLSSSNPAVLVNFDLPEEEEERKDALPSHLGDPMDTAVFDSSDSESEVTLNGPKIGGIAARRQRRCPPSLAFPVRSVSYSLAAPASPNAVTSVSPNHLSLRRIRSHGPGLANAGKIMKETRPQKSPLLANFVESALSSPRLQRHATFSVASGVNSSSTTATVGGTLAPPTPNTPGVYEAGFPGWQGTGNDIVHSPDAFSNTAEDVMYMPASSPTQDPRLEHVGNPWSSREDLFHTPPQSAPPTQQQFALNPCTTQNMVVRDGPSQIRAPSLPEDGAPQAQWLHPVDPQMHYASQIPYGLYPEQLAMPLGCGTEFMPMHYAPPSVFHPGQDPLQCSHHTLDDYRNGARPR